VLSFGGLQEKILSDSLTNVGAILQGLGGDGLGSGQAGVAKFNSVGGQGI